MRDQVICAALYLGSVAASLVIVFSGVEAAFLNKVQSDVVPLESEHRGEEETCSVIWYMRSV